jgi:hypothetical protein
MKIERWQLLLLVVSFLLSACTSGDTEIKIEDAWAGPLTRVRIQPFTLESQTLKGMTLFSSLTLHLQ